MVIFVQTCYGFPNGSVSELIWGAMTRVAVYFFCLCFILLIASPVFAEKRVALVIGNSTYKNISKLNNPVNDARLMVRVLEKQGFEVVQGRDLEYRAMKRLIRSYTKKLQDYGRDTVGFIFYAGHGLQIGGTNYLIPVGAEIGKQGDVDIEAISASSLLFGVKEARNRLNIIVLDACRNNPYRGMFRSVSRGLSQMSAPSGSLIAFSTGPGDVAADGTGKNSPFTAALAKSLRVPGLTIERVFKRARQQVYDSSNKQQLPWINSSLLGEFYPAGQQREKTVRSEPIKSSDVAREWQSLSSSNDIEDLKAFITRFGKAFPYYGRKAKKRIAALMKVKSSVRVTAVQQKNISTASPNDTCITIGRKIARRIKLVVGMRFCDAGGRNEAKVTKIANRAVVFLDNGASKTCSQGRLCAFNWPVKPLFRITARADAARGIAPHATMEPR
jgi:Caspase domain